MFSTTAPARPRSATSERMRASWSVGPSRGVDQHEHHVRLLERAERHERARRARRAGRGAPGRRRPAVSMKTKARLLALDADVDRVARRARASPRPRRARRRGCGSGASSCPRSGGRGARRAARRRAARARAPAAASAATSSSSRSKAPPPCSAETPRTRSKPSRWNSPTRARVLRVVDLVDRDRERLLRAAQRARQLGVLGQEARPARRRRRRSRPPPRSRRAPAPAPPSSTLGVAPRGRAPRCRRAGCRRPASSISSTSRSRVTPGTSATSAAAPGVAVEEGRLPDVRAAHDRDDGELGHGRRGCHSAPPQPATGAARPESATSAPQRPSPCGVCLTTRAPP